MVKRDAAVFIGIVLAVLVARGIGLEIWALGLAFMLGWIGCRFLG